MSNYISREAAFKEFAEFVRRSNNSDFVDAPTWNDAVSLIGSLPAADVAPVVHGEWIQINGHRYCNVCGHKDSPILTNYCPNCGAKMNGGDHDAAD